MDNKGMILGFPREIKIKLLKDALKQNEFGIFLGLTKILLDAPISQGGIESEIIEQIQEDHLNEIK